MESMKFVENRSMTVIYHLHGIKAHFDRIRQIQAVSQQLAQVLVQAANL